MQGHVFISHSSEDRDTATRLVEAIEAQGVQAWIAPRDVRAGRDFSDQLEQAIVHCAAFVVLLSQHSNKSMFVRAETENAFRLSKPIFPVRLSDVEPASGLGLFLRIHHWTDAFGPNRQSNLDRLANELTGVGPVDSAALPPGRPPPEKPVSAPGPLRKPLPWILTASAISAVAITALLTRPAVPDKRNDAVSNTTLSTEVATNAVAAYSAPVVSPTPEPVLADAAYLVGRWTPEQGCKSVGHELYDGGTGVAFGFGSIDVSWSLSDGIFIMRSTAEPDQILLKGRTIALGPDKKRVVYDNGKFSDWYRCH